MKWRLTLVLVATMLVFAPSCLPGPAPPRGGTLEQVTAGETNCEVIEVIYRRSYSYEDALEQARLDAFNVGANAYRIIAATGSSVTLQALHCALPERNYLRGEERANPER